MSKVLRRKIVDELVKKYEGARNVVLLDYRGLKGNQAVELRRELRASQVQLNVVKNAIAAHTFDRLGLKELTQNVGGMTALACGPDPLALAKKLYAYKEKNKTLEIRAGYIEGKFMSAEQVKQLAQLPAREELLAQTIGTVVAPLTSVLGCIDAIISELLSVIEQVKEKQEKGG